MSTAEMINKEINHSDQKYPFCIVWTPIPVLTWFFPFIGHMGIGMSSGVIRDFAGSYHVGTDNMAFGKPTRYWQLDPKLSMGGEEGWDKGIAEACEIYKTRVHNLCCDNCHSHVATALNKMSYNSSSKWNMVKLAFLMFIKSKYVNCIAFAKTWFPFFIIAIIIVLLVIMDIGRN